MRYVMHEGKMVPAHHRPRRQVKRSDLAAPGLIGLFEPYRSMITDEIVETRGEHRDLLKEHGYDEVGSETPDFIRERRYMRKHDHPVPDQVKHPDGPPVDDGAGFTWQEPDDDLDVA